MRLETNKFNFTKQLINEKMNHVLKEWNTSFKNNRGENIKQELKNKMVEWFECHPMVLLENEARENQILNKGVKA